MTLLDTEQQSYCNAAFNYSLRGMFTDMDRNLAKLTPQSQAALLVTIDTLSSALRLKPVVQAILTPDALDDPAIAQQAKNPDDLEVRNPIVDLVPLPIGVEGHAIVGGRTR